MTGQESSQRWEVVVARVFDQGNPAEGAEEDVLASSAEAEARRVYANAVAEAADAGYAYVRLRSEGREVESWPQATGWTS